MSKLTSIDEPIFRDGEDYFQVAKNIKDIYFSDGTMITLIDYERCLDDLGLYAFKNWEIGELVSGPIIKPYQITCIFMWPDHLMPDPRGARRLLPFDCKVKFKKTVMQVPMKISDPSDYRPGTHKAKLVDHKIWLVEITIPKNLINDIKTGSVEIEDEEVDLQELEDSYSKDLDKDSTKTTAAAAAPAAGAPGMGM